KLAVLLHDVGHGPLSHVTEEVMPKLRELAVDAYKDLRTDIGFPPIQFDGQANHEDYTIKFITDSSLTPILRKAFPDISPLHIACLIDKRLRCTDDFFKDQGCDVRSLLCQIVS